MVNDRLHYVLGCADELTAHGLCDEIAVSANPLSPPGVELRDLFFQLYDAVLILCARVIAAHLDQPIRFAQRLGGATQGTTGIIVHRDAISECLALRYIVLK